MTNKCDIPITCFAEGTDGDWEALCLNFDLAAQGDSFEEVYEVLNEMIKGYIETVSTYPKTEQKKFLNRKAPLLLRIKYALLYLQIYFGHRSDKERHNYTANACPA